MITEEDKIQMIKLDKAVLEMIELLESLGTDSTTCIENNNDGTPSGYCDEECCRLHHACLTYKRFNIK